MNEPHPTPAALRAADRIEAIYSRLSRADVALIFDEEMQAERQLTAELLAACKSLLAMLDRGDKPAKLDEALCWRDNDELARSRAENAIAKAESI